MPFRARLLLALVVLVVIGAGAVVTDGHPRLGGIEANALGAVEGGSAVVAARSRPASPPVMARPAASTWRAVTSVAPPRLRRSPDGGLRMRLDEDGDRWRALLVGAPPPAP